MKKYHLWEIATAVFVMLLSPASVVFGVAIGIPHEAWLMTYLRYVAVFITLTIVVALAGFDVAISYWPHAERAKTQRLKDKPWRILLSPDTRTRHAGNVTALSSSHP